MCFITSLSVALPLLVSVSQLGLSTAVSILHEALFCCSILIAYMQHTIVAARAWELLKEMTIDDW